MKYQLFIKIPFEALDDIEARKMAITIMGDPVVFIEGNKTDRKLQRLYIDRPPERVSLEL